MELTIVHRQAQRSGILSSANLVREGEQFIEGNFTGTTRLGELEDLFLYAKNNKESVLKTTLSIAEKYKGDVMDFQIIAPMKSRGAVSTSELNAKLQVIFNGDTSNVDDNKKVKRSKYSIVEGDKVILNGNNNDKMIFNGTMGIVTHVDISAKDNKGNTVGEVVVNFESLGNMSLTMEEMKHVDLAYAITCHKSQGSQWRFVVLSLDYSSYILLTRQLIYTAMTRASEALFMPVEMKALNYAISNDKSTKRRTFLSSIMN